MIKQEGWKIFLKENCTRYPDKMLQKYFQLDSKPEDSTPENTV
jgi:hypothetical protein